MKLVKEPYDCPNCKARLNMQWDFDPWKIYWKCEECGSWLHHAHVMDLYEIYDGPSPYGNPMLDTDDFDAGDAESDNFNSPSSDGERKLGQEVAELEELFEEDSFEEAPVKVKDEWEEAVRPEPEKAEKVDPTRKKGLTWPFGKKKEDPEDTFAEAELPEEDEWDEDELDEPKKKLWEGKLSKESFKKENFKKVKAQPEPSQEEPAKGKPEKEKPRKRDKIKGFFGHLRRYGKIYMVIIALLAAAIVGFTIYRHFQKLITVGVSSKSVSTMDYQDVVEILEKSGFEAIETIPLEDLNSKTMSKENKVDMITIGGETNFDETTRLPYDSEVVIQYHSAKTIKMPLDPKTVTEKTVQELQNLLEKAGFENVKTEADYDLWVGILHKEGDVEKVTVDGSEKFTEQQPYRIDTEIVITYHDYKKNKKEQ